MAKRKEGKRSLVDGITIIETISRTIEYPAFSWVAIVGLIAISIAAIYEAALFFEDKKIIEGACALLIVAVSIILGLNSSGVFVDNTQTETLYVVQVDDNVSVKEFHEHYEVVSVDEDRYTVRIID